MLRVEFFHIFTIKNELKNVLSYRKIPSKHNSEIFIHEKTWEVRENVHFRKRLQFDNKKTVRNRYQDVRGDWCKRKSKSKQWKKGLMAVQWCTSCRISSIPSETNQKRTFLSDTMALVRSMYDVDMSVKFRNFPKTNCHVTKKNYSVFKIFVKKM